MSPRRYSELTEDQAAYQYSANDGAAIVEPSTSIAAAGANNEHKSRDGHVSTARPSQDPLKPAPKRWWQTRTSFLTCMTVVVSCVLAAGMVALATQRVSRDTAGEDQQPAPSTQPAREGPVHKCVFDELPRPALAPIPPMVNLVPVEEPAAASEGNEGTFRNVTVTTAVVGPPEQAQFVYDHNGGNTEEGMKLHRRNTYAPFRLRLDTTYIDVDLAGDSTMRDYIKFSLFPYVEAYFARVLSVVPRGAYLLNRVYGCTQVWGNGNCRTYVADGDEVIWSSMFTTPFAWRLNGESLRIPTKYFANYTWCPTSQNSCTSSLTAGGMGENIDALILTTAQDTSVCQGNAAILAYAQAGYNRDTLDRPLLGFINICPLALTGFDEKDHAAVVVHELSHVFAYSPTNYAYFRDSAGSPRTPRDGQGNPVSGGSIVVSANTVTLFAERGNNVPKFVTPAALAAARATLGCPTLNGLELDSDSSAHLEARVYGPEVMTATYNRAFPCTFSRVFWSIFEDSGWYQVNSLFKTLPSWWASPEKGCAFAVNKCVDPASSNVSNALFCTANGDTRCGYGRLGKGYCFIATYGSSLPTQYQYFSGSPTLGGTSSAADFCPFYQYFNTQAGCRQGTLSGTNIALGERNNGQSLCYSSTAVPAGTSPPGSYTARCYTTECYANRTGYAVAFGDGTVRVDCGAGGSVIDVGAATGGSFVGMLECPPMSEVCTQPDCTDQCNARGTCLYQADNTTTCLCIPGYGGDACESVTLDVALTVKGTSGTSERPNGFVRNMTNVTPIPSPSPTTTVSPSMASSVSSSSSSGSLSATTSSSSGGSMSLGGASSVSSRSTTSSRATTTSTPAAVLVSSTSTSTSKTSTLLISAAGTTATSTTTSVTPTGTNVALNLTADALGGPRMDRARIMGGGWMVIVVVLAALLFSGQ